MKDFTVHSLFRSMTHVTVDKTDRYVLTYPVYVNSFLNHSVLSSEDIVRCVGFVYSWMPRILKICAHKLEPFQQAVNSIDASANKNSQNELFGHACSLLDGSVIGSSKLLHFLRPSIFPIYDRHVYSYCWPDDRAHYYNVKKVSNYLEYFDRVTLLSHQESSAELRELVSQRLGYDVSTVRAIEFSIFHVSKNNCA